MAKNSDYSKNPKNQFVKGQKRECQGRGHGPNPVFRSFKDVFEKFMKMTEAELELVDEDSIPIYEAMALAQLRQAKRGKGDSFDRIADRVDGKPKQMVTISKGQDEVADEEILKRYGMQAREKPDA